MCVCSTDNSTLQRFIMTRGWMYHDRIEISGWTLRTDSHCSQSPREWHKKSFRIETSSSLAVEKVRQINLEVQHWCDREEKCVLSIKAGEVSCKWSLLPVVCVIQSRSDSTIWDKPVQQFEDGKWSVWHLNILSAL